MAREAVVRDVIEKNDCAGKKYIYVTTMEDDELIKSRFQLTRTWMPPDDKLFLASVAPEDKIIIDPCYFNHDLLVTGEFKRISTDGSFRDPLCRCHQPMVSDGFDVYCLNQDCALTVFSRIDRLANSSFYNAFEHRFNHDTHSVEMGFSIGEASCHFRPFSIILNGLFWGNRNISVEHILLTRMTPSPTMATFLVKPLLEEFLENIHQNDYFDKTILSSIYQFYADMEEFINRRDVNSFRQNFFIKGFFHALGVESITEDIVNRLLRYETNYPDIEPMLVYAYALTHGRELVEELNFHPLEARTLLSEIARRKHEIFDIFYHYTNNNPDIIDCFKHMM